MNPTIARYTIARDGFRGWIDGQTWIVKAAFLFAVLVMSSALPPLLIFAAISVMSDIAGG